MKRVQKVFQRSCGPFLRGSKPVSSMASTVPIVGPNIGIEHGEHVPEQRSNFSLFGPGNVDTEQSIGLQPQQTVCENVFGAPGYALQNDRHLRDVGDHHSQNGGANCGGYTPSGPPNRANSRRSSLRWRVP